MCYVTAVNVNTCATILLVCRGLRLFHLKELFARPRAEIQLLPFIGAPSLSLGGQTSHQDVPRQDWPLQESGLKLITHPQTHRKWACPLQVPGIPEGKQRATPPPTSGRPNTVFLIFEGTAILFFIAAAPFYVELYSLNGSISSHMSFISRKL